MSFASLIALTAVVASSAGAADPAQVTAALAADRGITLYLPFEDSAEPGYSRTGAPATYNDSVRFVEGRLGQAALLRRSREVEEGKAQGRASGLNYDALGLLYGERGAAAFWFQPPWDGSDPTIRSGPNGTGPSLIGVSSVEPTYFQQFVRWQIKGGAFYTWIVDRSGKPHGTSDSSRLNTWRRGEWHHLAMSWDCEQGVRFYEDGELVYDTWGTEQWMPATPWTIGVGSTPPHGRPATVTCADMILDEMLLFDRPLSPPDVQAAMAGDYAAISPAPPAVTPEAQRRARVLAYGLASSDARPPVPPSSSGWAASVRLADPLSIDTRFINGRFLSDGLKTRPFHLSQGGLQFDRDVTLTFPADARPSYVLLSGAPADGSELAAGGAVIPLQPGPDQSQRVALREPAPEVVLKLKAGSSLGECQALSIEPGFAGREPELEPLGLIPDPAALGADGDELWREFAPSDRRALVPGQPTAESLRVPVSALGKLHLFSGPAGDDVGIAAIRLRLAFTSLKSEAALAVKVHDPFEPERFRLLVDLALAPSAQSMPRLDLTLIVPGLILPQAQRLWVEIVPDHDAELLLGSGGCAVGVEGCPARSVRASFSRSYLRFLNEEFRTRMAHNFKYYSRGVQADNALTRGLGNIRAFDPDNSLARSMHHWARLSPWPEWMQDPPGPESAPRWARLQRAAVSEALATIHWWIDNRQDETGYVVGNADAWNDDTKLFNEYAVFALTTGDEKLISAMEQYLDAHYASGRMEQGYSRPLTDIVHSQEEASYLAPTLALLRYGDPVQVERLMETTANIPYWTASPEPGRRHFRSNFYTATQMKTDGRFGHDVPLNAATLVPAMMLSWYNGHPLARQWLLEYADAWCAAAERQTDDKPTGLLPAFVDPSTGAIGSAKGVYQRELAYQLLAAHALSGDARHLAPIEEMIRQLGAQGIGMLGPAALEWRRLGGVPDLDGPLRDYADTLRAEMAQDSFFQRGVERYDVGAVLGYMLTDDPAFLELGLLHAWRNNARARPIYTLTDPDKDRVYPWGRVLLPWMMCGGSALNARASAPWPTIAVSWERTGTDFAAWVKQRSPQGLTIETYNFGPEREVVVRPWALEPGRYELALRASRSGTALRTDEMEVRRGSPVPVRLPSAQLVELVLSQTRAAEPPAPAPDAAVSAAEIAGGMQQAPGGPLRMSVPVHNIGTEDLRRCRVQVRDAGQRLVAEAALDDIPAPRDLRPRTQTADVSIPPGAVFPLTVAVETTQYEITTLNNTCALQVAPGAAASPEEQGEGNGQ